MKILLTIIPSLLLLMLPWLCRAQQSDPFYQSVVDQVSQDTVLANLQKFESLGIKQPGSIALDNTADWIIEKYKSFGYTSITRDTFNYNGHQLFNIVITKLGMAFPPSYLIIDGHYDTYNGPGVNDNGSGVATILEIARLLSTITTRQSLRFIHFSAEEEGLIGSQHYVDHTVIPSNMNIGLVLNIDEVGGVAGMVNNTITCERDESSPTYNNSLSWAYTDTLVALTGLYSDLSTVISYAYGSDYVPFQEAGKVITGYYETNESPYTHSPNDILARMSPEYVTRLSRAATGAALYFSGANQTNPVMTEEFPGTAIKLAPNPAIDYISWPAEIFRSAYKVCLLDGSGKTILTKDFNPDETTSLTISKLQPGIYCLRFIPQDIDSSITLRFLHHL